MVELLPVKGISGTVKNTHTCGTRVDKEQSLSPWACPPGHPKGTLIVPGERRALQGGLDEGDKTKS